MATIQERLAADGSKSYRVQIRLRGFPAATATFSRLTDARKWVQKTETEIRERRYFKTSEARKRTLAELIDSYTARVKVENPKRYPEVKQMLEWWKNELGMYLLCDLSKSLISKKIDELSQRKKTRTNKLEQAKQTKQLISPSRVNRYISALSHCITIGVNEWEWLDDNPLRKISKRKEPKGRIRFLSDTERQNLLNACKNSEYKPLLMIVVLAISTGARRGEIMNLRWPDIDMKRGQLVFQHTKNGDRRLLPITGYALELMHAHQSTKHNHSDLLFPYSHADKPYDISTVFERALVAAKISSFRFHDLRHSAASYLAMNGASLAEIAEVLGHKTLAMVKRYAHLTDAHTAGVVAKMNERIFKDVAV